VHLVGLLIEWIQSFYFNIFYTLKYVFPIEYLKCYYLAEYIRIFLYKDILSVI
jgi:hypothetical protein